MNNSLNNNSSSNSGNKISSPNLLIKYQEQNAEIIKANIRLNERIAILESVISQLQQENLQLRISNVKKTRRKGVNKSTISSSPASPTPPPPPTQPPSVAATIEQETMIPTNTQKRSCASRPISYTLPNAKCKLRKGDPYTFGYEEQKKK